MTDHCSTCNKYTITQQGDMYEMGPRPFGSYYYTVEEFECFNPCKDCNRKCDKCDDFGEIETVTCYHCEYEISNCQVFTCPNYECVPQCLQCARPDKYSGLCRDCHADLCDAQTECEIDCQS